MDVCEQRPWTLAPRTACLQMKNKSKSREPTKHQMSTTEIQHQRQEIRVDTSIRVAEDEDDATPSMLALRGRKRSYSDGDLIERFSKHRKGS